MTRCRQRWKKFPPWYMFSLELERGLPWSPVHSHLCGSVCTCLLDLLSLYSSVSVVLDVWSLLHFVLLPLCTALILSNQTGHLTWFSLQKESWRWYCCSRTMSLSRTTWTCQHKCSRLSVCPGSPLEATAVMSGRWLLALTTLPFSQQLQSLWRFGTGTQSSCVSLPEFRDAVLRKAVIRKRGQWKEIEQWMK